MNGEEELRTEIQESLEEQIESLLTEWAM